MAIGWAEQTKCPDFADEVCTVNNKKEEEQEHTHPHTPTPTIQFSYHSYQLKSIKVADIYKVTKLFLTSRVLSQVPTFLSNPRFLRSTQCVMGNRYSPVNACRPSVMDACDRTVSQNQTNCRQSYFSRTCGFTPISSDLGSDCRVFSYSLYKNE